MNMNYKTYRKIKNILFTILVSASAILILTPLFLVTQLIITKGIAGLNWDFFTSTPKPIGETGGGMKHAIMGTLYIVGIGTLLSVPIGLTCGVYLSEFKKSKMAKFLNICVDLMNGIPSIVIGIFAYLVLVVPLKSFSALAGGFAISLIMLPIIIKTSVEILQLVPKQIREAGLALGLTRWKVILLIVVKGSIPSLLTGILLAISRAAGETAPLLFTAFGNMYLSYDPKGPMASLPVQIYNYAISPFKEWQKQAWSGAIVLVGIILIMNLVSRFILMRINNPQRK